MTLNTNKITDKPTIKFDKICKTYFNKYFMKDEKIIINSISMRIRKSPGNR